MSQTVHCRECGRDRQLHLSAADTAKLVALQFCDDCYYWHSFVILKDDPNMARIGGKHYFIGSETDSDKGFSGATYQVRFIDGRKVTTTNLNYNGIVPDAWKTRLPDTAEFIK